MLKSMSVEKFAGKIVGILFGSLLPVVLGTLILIYGGREIKHSKECLNWPETKGVITDSYIGESRNEDSSVITYYPDIFYSYNVIGKQYSGSRLSYRSVSDTDKKAIEAVLSDYARGNTVSVYYKPDNPEFSVLQKGEPISDSILYFGLFLVILGTGITLIIIFEKE